MLRSATMFCVRSFAAQAAFLIASMFTLGHCADARAETLGSYYHTSFLKQEGSPVDVGGLAQTSDGFLWIAGTKGLTRFDGNAFTTFHALPGERLPDAQLDELFPAEGGGLWIAYGSKGVTLLKDGHLRNFGLAQGYQGGHGHFMRDNSGHVWSYTFAALMRFEQGAWRVIYQESPGHAGIYDAHFDTDGNLWATIERRLCVRPANSSQFLAVPNGPAEAGFVFTGASGHVYVVNKEGLHIYRRNGLSLVEEAKPIPLTLYVVVEGRGGSLWLGSQSQGLYYVSGDDLKTAEASHASPRLQQMTQADGLTGDYISYLLQDSEGDVWVGTPGGLDRFRRAAFTRIDLPPGIHTVSASEDPLGNLWIGSETKPLLFGPASGELQETDVPKLTLASYIDPRDKSAWAANVEGVWRLIPGAPHLEKALTSTETGVTHALPCMLRDSQGIFYVCISYGGPGGGLLVSDGDGWKQVFDHPVFPLTLAADAAGGVWAGGSERNHLYELLNGRHVLLDEHQGLAVGVIRAIEANGGTLWVGGDEGIQFFDGRRFVTLIADNQEIMKPVTGIVEDRHGDLWVQTLDGVLRIRADDIKHFRGGDLKQVHANLFDDADGIPGATGLSWTHPTLRMGADGKIWAQTETGLAWIDPDHIPLENSRPPVYIDTLDAADRNYPATDNDIHLPASDSAFRISYSAPSLNRPDKMSFRYRLVGMTDTWQAAGDRREVSFTNVPPGTYRFEVTATNESGLSSPAAVLTFERLPAYYETWWFRALWALPVALLLWVAHDMRTRAVARRLKIRSDEREAVARDIHDTLLQRLQAVTLSLKGLSSDETIPGASREIIAQVCDETRDAISDMRGQIFALRRNQDPGLALYDQLMTEGRRLQARGNAHFALEVHGSPRSLKIGPEIELREIALEAIRNAYAHSNAAHITVTFNYEDRAFWLVVSDDGIGLSEKAADQARREGHFGLVGMRERVAGLKGSINIESAPEEGTEVHIRVPARVIYVSARH